MPYFSPKFCGLTVRDFSVALGLGSQTSQLTVKCLRDARLGDSPDIPPLGSPVYFQFAALKFWGLLQRHTAADGVDGKDLHDFTLVDPREILEGTEVITYAYTGSVNGVPNLLNAYGYFEQGVAFGKSGATAAGMPWARVLEAVHALTGQSAQGTHGGPLNYRGFRYGVDLSDLPAPPAYYRLAPGKVGLLEAVTQVCEDSGCDFFVHLDGPVIRVRTVSRAAQAPLGTLAESLLAGAALADGIVRAEAGVECRNEVTSCFLVGGEKTSVFLSGGIISYWGRAVDGSPVLGVPFLHPGYGACEAMALNALDLADVVGNVSYETNTIELCAALQGPEAWGAYVGTYKKQLAAVIGSELYGAKPDLPFAPALKQDVVRDDPATVARLVDIDMGKKRARLFSFVRRTAEDFYGKHFLVQIPFVLAKTDPETLKVTTTFEPVASGYLRYGAAEVGVPAHRLDVLQDADDRVLPFAYYPAVLGADTDRLSENDSVVAGGECWTRCSNGTKIIVLTGPLQIPCVHVRLGAALYAAKPLGGPGAKDMLLATDFAPGTVDQMEANAPAGGTLGHLDLHPPALYPAAFGVPLKSTTECYGPWFVKGAPGKVRYEQDPSLTPWDYGGEALMNLAGDARVVNAVSNSQLAETGSVHRAGPPAYSPGEVVAAGGPNLTHVEVAYGPGGVTTTYRFQTFTQRFGLFSRQNAERLKRAALALVEVRRQARKAFAQAALNQGYAEKAARPAKDDRAVWHRRQSPHTVLVGHNVVSGATVRAGAGAETYEAGIVLSADADYRHKAVMSVSGLVRPFSTNPATASPLARYTAPTVPAGMVPVTNFTLNPFAAGNDVEVLAWGQAYAGAHARHRGADPADTRALALRGPLVVSGHGPGVEGGGAYYPAVAGYLRRADLWKTGAVDLLWDNKRGVWTSHDVMSGTLAAAVPAGATGVVNVGGSAAWQMTARNPWSGTVNAGRVLISYVLNLNEWVVSAADCTN